MKPLATWFSMLLFALLTTGCSLFVNTENENYGERTTGSWIEDEAIETKVQANLQKADPGFEQAHIVVVSYNGIVLITGQVPNDKLKEIATTVAKQTRKVRKVHNELAVSGPTSGLTRTADNWISTKVKSKLLLSSQTEGGRVRVVTENGVVYLMGLLKRSEAEKVVRVVSSTGGVQKIVKIFEYIDQPHTAM